MSFQFKTYFKTWFANRMPVGNTIRLNQRSTYIWPTKSGYLLIGILLLMMVGATNYQNNLAFLLTFLLVGIGFSCIIFTFKNLQGIEFSIQSTEAFFANQSVSIEVNVKSFVTQEHYTIGIGLSYKTLIFFDVFATKTNQIKIDTGVTTRGWYAIPRLMVSSQFPFGWLRTWAYFNFDQKLLIYPQPIEPVLVNQQNDGNEAEEGEQIRGSDDLYGLKPYQQGEPLTRVDWKSYARERGMFVRELTSYQSQPLCFSWFDFPGELIEKRLSYLTYMVLEANNQQLSYSVVLPDQRFDFDDSLLHRNRCLKALALYNLKPDKKVDDD